MGDATLSMGTPPRLEVRGLTKHYEGVEVLGHVDLVVDKGEVLGIVGENGAGKSTLLNILSGVTRPDDGSIFVDGVEVTPREYLDANSLGIFRVFQEPALVPNATIYENIFLAHERRFERFGVLNRRLMARKTADFLSEFEHDWVDPSGTTRDYDLSVRRVIEIIKAFAMAEFMGTDAPILLLDEPTAGLQEAESRFFQKVVDRVRPKAATIFVEHHLSYLLDLSDRVLVLKDGRVTGEGPAARYSESDLHQLMVGRSRSQYFYGEDRQTAPADRTVLKVQNLARAGSFSDVSFQIAAGEILGVAGLMDSGKLELGLGLWGGISDLSGEIEIDGKSAPLGDIAASLKNHVAYVAPSRAESVLPGLSISWNTSLFRLNATASKGPLLDLREERRSGEGFMTTLAIRAPDIRTPLRSLSGGNQQKVVLARCLAIGVRLLILNNPTYGVDVGAREDIYGLLRDLSDGGTAILLISDDLPEVIGLSHRLMLMRAGHLEAILETPPDAKSSEHEVLRHLT